MRLLLMLALVSCAPVDDSSRTDPPSEEDGTDTNDITDPDDGDDGTPVTDEGRAVGMNLGPVESWMAQWVWTDAFKSARPWIPQLADSWEWDTGEELHLTNEGWIEWFEPGQAAGTLMFDGLEGHYPAGVYTVLYTGGGELEFGRDASVISSAPGWMQIEVAPTDAGIYVKQVASTPGDPLKNLRVIMPGFEDSYHEQKFHPLFLDGLRGVEVIRFMDWQHTNDSTLERWSHRTERSNATQVSEHGVAIEEMVDLANELGADPWFCVPHGVDDHFLWSMAATIRDRLNSDRKVYIEWSNEVWNDQFFQSAFATDQGQRLGLDSTAFGARLAFQARRSTEVFDIFDSAFGDEERVVRVLGSQNGNPWVTETLLNRIGPDGVDALAIAPYFGGPLGLPDMESTVQDWSVDEVFEALDGELSDAMEKVREHKAFADEAGVELIAYEGGQHLVGVGRVVHNERITKLFADTNHDGRMGPLYTRYLDEWDRIGGELFVAFNYVERWTEYGAWGALQYQDTPREHAPKYDALLKHMGR